MIYRTLQADKGFTVQIEDESGVVYSASFSTSTEAQAVIKKAVKDGKLPDQPKKKGK